MSKTVYIVAVMVVLVVASVGVYYMSKPLSEPGEKQIVLQLGEAFRLSDSIWICYSGLSHVVSKIGCISVIQDGEYTIPLYVYVGSEFVIREKPPIVTVSTRSYRILGPKWNLKVVDLSTVRIVLEITN